MYPRLSRQPSSVVFVICSFISEDEIIEYNKVIVIEELGYNIYYEYPLINEEFEYRYLGTNKSIVVIFFRRLLSRTLLTRVMSIYNVV